jgi:hypothetical protein
MTQASPQTTPTSSLGSTVNNVLENLQDTAATVLGQFGLGVPTSNLKRGQAWERDYTCKSGDLTFQLHLRRDKDGRLEGHYRVQQGNGQAGERWPLTGELHRDDTFTLAGTQNRAHFRGSLKGGIPKVQEFTNGEKFKRQDLLFTWNKPATPMPSSGQVASPAVAPPTGSAPAAHSTGSPLPNLPAFKEPGFLPRLRQVAARINTTPEIVLAFLNLESNLDPTTGRRSSSQYQGLGQIGNAALIDINKYILRKKLPVKTLASTKDLNKLSATQQLEYVEIHLFLHMNGVDKENKAAGTTTSLEEVYMGHLGGSARYARQDTWVSAGSAAYLQNPMDANNDGRNTPTEAADTVRGKFTANFKQNLDERSRHLKPTRRMFNKKMQLFYVFDPKFDNGFPMFKLDATTSTAPAPQPAPPLSDGTPAPIAPEAPASAGEPDALDRLLKFTVDTPEYTAAQVRMARQLIKLQPESERAALYLLLQEKTPHHNQRNNLSRGRSVDGDRQGAPIGNVMCNMTSAAMVLEQLGIENPDPEHFPQFEDYLEDLRRKFVDAKYKELLAAGLSQKKAYQGSYGRFHRTMAEGWGKVLELMGATHSMLTPQRDRSFWEGTVLKQLASGAGIMMSINGHIVRLQGMNDEGLIVDDPYGNSKLLSNIGLDPKYKSGKYRHNANVSGNNTVWPWDAVAKHDMLWIAVVRKK